MPRKLTEAFTREDLVQAFRRLGADSALCEAEADAIFSVEGRNYWFEPGFFRNLAAVSPEVEARVREFLEEHKSLHFLDEPTPQD
jgi:hypothetical protein